MNNNLLCSFFNNGSKLSTLKITGLVIVEVCKLWGISVIKKTMTKGQTEENKKKRKKKQWQGKKIRIKACVKCAVFVLELC